MRELSAGAYQLARGLWSGSLIHALVVRALAGVSDDPSLAKAMAKRRIILFIEQHRDSD